MLAADRRQTRLLAAHVSDRIGLARRSLLVEVRADDVVDVRARRGVAPRIPGEVYMPRTDVLDLKSGVPWTSSSVSNDDPPRCRPQPPMFGLIRRPRYTIGLTSSTLDVAHVALGVEDGGAVVEPSRTCLAPWPCAPISKFMKPEICPYWSMPPPWATLPGRCRCRRSPRCSRATAARLIARR